MTKEEIQKLFNHPPFEYIPRWCRDIDIEAHERTIKKQGEEFREFWHSKILNSDYQELSESDMNRVILFFDSTASGSREFQENGGVPIAKANLRKPQWYKALRALKHNQDIREILNKILTEKDDNVIIDLINELEKVNRGNGNSLTGKGTVVLSAILFTYNPNKYLSMLLLNHRLALIDFFGLDNSHSYQTYGEQITGTNNDIISGFKNNFGIDTTLFKLSVFIYCQLDGKYNWLKNAKKIGTNIPNKTSYYSEVNELDIVVQRERIPDRVKREVWRRDKGRCAECGSREKLEYDHIIPISKGGSSTVRNIELLCENCNRKKSSKI
ncbi:MAG: HNH endonuclease [Minisyncoccales bacterium]